jgi:hypothetical protein
MMGRGVWLVSLIFLISAVTPLENDKSDKKPEEEAQE